jgi:alkyl sulfatase BDS1-like metallo-beta-lactamase superfamily hydrolase
MVTSKLRIQLLRCALLGVACAVADGAPAQQIAPKDAEPATRAANAALERTLPFADRADFDDPRRGFVGTIAGGRQPGVPDRRAQVETR